MQSIDNTNKDIVDSLSDLIRSALARADMEEIRPDFNPDKADATIQFHRERAATLRRLREEFENEMARDVRGPF